MTQKPSAGMGDQQFYQRSRGLVEQRNVQNKMILNIAARSKGKGKVNSMSGQVVRFAGWSLVRFRSVICIFISPVLGGLAPCI